MGFLEDIDTQFKTGSYRHVWKKAGYIPHKHQEVFHAANFRYRALISGIGGGKTIAGAAESVRAGLEEPGSRHIVAAPTYPTLRKSTIVEFMRFLSEDMIEYWNKTENELKLKNGSVYWFVSLEDPDRQARGPTVASVWIDEGSYITEYSFKVLIGRIRQPGYTQRLWITTTPKGYNYLHKYFVVGPRNDAQAAKDYWYIQFKTKDNPFLTADYIRSLESTYTGAFAAQELEGMFVGFAGLVYSKFQESIHVGDFKDKKFKEIVYGVDWGYNNPQVILAIGLDTDDNMYVVEELHQSGLTLDEVIPLANEMVDTWGPGKFVCDPSEPGNIETFNRNGLWASGAYNQIMEGIQIVSSRLEIKDNGKPRLFIDKRCIKTIEEFMSYHYPDEKEEKPVKEAPVKVNDHALDALRYAVCEIDKMRGKWSVLKLASLDSIL